MPDTTEHITPLPKQVTDSILFLWIGSFVAIIITFLVIFFKINPNPDSTYALHYTVLVGVDLLGKGSDFYKIPTVGLIIIAVNYGVYRLLRSPRNILSLFLALSSLLVSVILLIATFFLIRVN